MSRLAVAGWALTILGCLIWVYGYFSPVSWQFIQWARISPWWISDYLPNWQSEIGALLAIFGSAPVYYEQYRELKNARAEE